MPTARRIAGIAGLAAGAALAAGTGAVIAVERAAAGRLRLRPDPEVGEAFGRLRGQAHTVVADDGVPLHVEVNGPDEPGPSGDGRPGPVTVIFSHGYALSQDVWHYQRRDLAASARLVFWDQRGHGKSGPCAQDSCTIPQLGADLHAVLTATAPGEAPVVLVGHSMGGMTIMALARQHPELFGSKVTGVVLISSVAAGVDPTIWIPMVLRPVARHAALPLLRGVSTGRRAALVERGREIGADLALLGTWYVAFGNPEISPAVVAFLERIIRATPVGVVAAFYLAVLSHDERASLSMLGRVPVTVIAGERDRLVSLGQSEELAAAIPGSELVVAPGAGHVVILEQPGLVNRVISDMISGSSAAAAERRPA